MSEATKSIDISVSSIRNSDVVARVSANARPFPGSGVHADLDVDSQNFNERIGANLMKRVTLVVLTAGVLAVILSPVMAQRPGGPPPGRRGPGPGRASTSGLQKGPLAKDDEEKHILDTLEAMREGPRFANVSPDDGRLLRLLVETMGAKNIVEIGTSTGESAVWMALALRKTDGHLYTHEIDESRAKVAQANFEKAGVDKIITIIMGDAHETVKQHKDPIDVLFLDADKEGYIDYLDKLMPLVRPGGLVIAHNMNTRQADPKYLKAITENPELETLILLKEGMGVGVSLKKR